MSGTHLIIHADGQSIVIMVTALLTFIGISGRWPKRIAIYW